jgi:adenylate cyclase
MTLSIRTKTTLILAALTTLPIVVVLWRVLPPYGEAVREGEKRNQMLAVTRFVSEVEHRIDEVREDAEAIAVALEAATDMTDEEAAEALVRRVVFRREHVATARFEVPTAGVDTVFSKPGVDTSEVPKSTAKMQRQATEHGVALERVSATQGALVVPVRPKKDGAVGFVTVPLYFKPFDETLAMLLDNPELSLAEASALLVGHEKHVLAARGVEVERGADGSAVGPMSRAPDRMTLIAGNRFQVQTEHDVDGVPSVTTIASIPSVGWGVVLWRPQAVAYAGYANAQQLATAIAAIAVLLALVAAFLSAGAFTKPILSLVSKARLIGERRWRDVPEAEARGDELGELSGAMSEMARNLEESEEEIERQAKLRGDLGRFVSAELVDALVAGEHSLELGGERRPISVLFADVVAFTPMAENHEPEVIVSLLNELFTVLTELVFRHGGTVDKFIGDCIMAVWGAPVGVEDHAGRALACAEDMMSFLETGREQWRERYGVELRLAIGVNSGEAIVGNIGSDKRMEYTVVGDVVNVAARLETLAKPDQVLVAEGTQQMVGDDFELVRLGSRRLTGREKETEVYELQCA